MKNHINNEITRETTPSFVNVDSLKNYWMERIIDLDRPVAKGKDVVVLVTRSFYELEEENTYVQSEYQSYFVTEKTKGEDIASTALNESLTSVSFKEDWLQIITIGVVLFDAPQCFSEYVVPFHHQLTKDQDKDNLSKLEKQTLVGIVSCKTLRSPSSDNHTITAL